ncbi:MAG: succinate dehydrogenase iron-sulfur subunit [Candidatus Thermoplasmatota archaeon]
MFINIQRYNKEKGIYFQKYDVPLTKGTVLDALFYILDELDSTLSFRYSCRGAVCGSCGMFINGSICLACKTQIKNLGNEIMIAPLPHLRVIKDLVVDMDNFFEKYEIVKPYLIPKKPIPKKENIQSIKDREKLNEIVDCILCGCCYSSCTPAWLNEKYIGPHALLKAYRFISDTRDDGKKERLKIINSEDGAWRCHTIFNCMEACPKNINITGSIQALKRLTLFNKS